MAAQSRPPKILVVPNEDGIGPSSLVSHVVRELVSSPHLSCHVTIWNQTRQHFNRSLYAEEIRSGRVALVPIWNLFLLVKDRGRVSIPKTLARIGDYAQQRRHYPPAGTPTDFDFVLDFGVPAAARSAAERGMRTISLFDHAWGKTLELILDDPEVAADLTLAEHDRAAWRRLIDAFREDERHIHRLYAFPECIMPELFAEYWRALGVPVTPFGAVLGGSPRFTPAQARAHLGFDRPGKIVLIQGGDTDAWVELLERLLAAADHPAQAERLDAQGIDVAVYIPSGAAALGARLPAAGGRVRQVHFVTGGTIQELLPAVSLLITRAGGGTVNDAVACRVPFVCVREPTQRQVAAILAACERQGLTRPIDYDAFLDDPIGTIVHELAQTEANAAISARARAIPAHGEQTLVQAIAALL